MTRWPIVLALLLAASACEKRAPPAPAQPPPPAPELARAVPADAAAPPAWTLALRSDYGPCPMNDPRPCHTTWVATADGKITVTGYANQAGQKDHVSTSQLSPINLDALRTLVNRPEFIGSMVRGWKCQGPAPSYDATMQLAFSDPATKLEAQQYVERCDRDAGTDTTLAQILGLLRRG